MKTTPYKICIALMAALFMVSATWSQTYNSRNNPDDGENQINGEKLTPELLANLGINTSPNPKNATVDGNSVYLRQIGSYNDALIHTRTNASDINVTQNGDYNDTYIDYTANTAIVDLLQNGNSNRFRDVVNDPRADISIDLVQDGSNLNFEREGVNDLTKSLKFRQTEASPTLIIRSYY